VTFRDDGEAQKHRIDALEDELEQARAEAEKLREERDAALAGPVSTMPRRWASGSAVWVEWNGTWWRAHIVHELGDGSWKIHYDGWSTKWDEAVGLARIAPGDEPAPGPIAKTSPVGGVLVLLVVGFIVAVVLYAILDGYL
jgi:hypothetical protein